MKRRHFMLGLGAAGIASAFAFKPRDAGAAYSPYFRELNNMLKKRGPYLPVMLIDLDRLDRNIQHLQSLVPADKTYRIVAKSLPSPQMLGYIMEKAGTNRLMVFHQPFLTDIVARFPDADVLIGKPMPVKAAAQFYRRYDNTAGFAADRQLQWLIDTETRLVQYQQLAEVLGVKMRINVELDVGLHRGGVQTPEELKPMLDRILAHPRYLELAGFMGYDPHIVKLPGWLKSPEQAYAESQASYRRVLDFVRAQYPSIDVARLCLNGAGSPSLPMHDSSSVLNELAAGSCLVKPTDFDITTLTAFEPAVFIATPVLKKSAGMALPGIESLKNIAPLWNPNLQQTYFIYGGKWMAVNESPRGLRGNPLFGTSTNQAILNGSRSSQIEVDDHIFLRPTQSEAVFLQFGDLLALKEGRIFERWPILKQ